MRPYDEMDFRTRNDYRNAVEDLSQHSGRDENAIASLALARAGAVAELEGPAAPRSRLSTGGAGPDEF